MQSSQTWLQAKTNILCNDLSIINHRFAYAPQKEEHGGEFQQQCAFTIRLDGHVVRLWRRHWIEVLDICRILRDGIVVDVLHVLGLLEADILHDLDLLPPDHDADPPREKTTRNDTKESHA